MGQMRFLGNMLKKLTITSNLGNLGTAIRGQMEYTACISRKFSSEPSFQTLEDVKYKGTSEQKKACLRKLIQAMTHMMHMGFEGGNVEASKIQISRDEVNLPDPSEEPFIAGIHPTYLSLVEKLAIYLHEDDEMNERDRMKYEDFKRYSRLASNERHLVLLAGHNHVQTRLQEMEYIPRALQQMELIPNAPNNKLFPLPPDQNCHQVPLELVDSCTGLYNWEYAYRKVCITREVNIKDAIQGSKELKNVFYYRGDYKESGYKNFKDPIHELKFYSNVVKHRCRKDGGAATLDVLHERFQNNTTEMYKFHWCYDGHANGIVNLEHIMDRIGHRLDRP